MRAKRPVAEVSVGDIVRILGGLGMRDVDVADLLGIAPSEIGHWRRGVRKPTGTARRILRMLEASPARTLSLLRAAAADDRERTS